MNGKRARTIRAAAKTWIRIVGDENLYDGGVITSYKTLYKKFKRKWTRGFG